MQAITFKNVFKQYRKGPKVIPTVREWATFLIKQKFKLQKNTFNALKNISLTIDQGEAVGFIGRNGAGKSTALKLMSKVTYPTKGEITISGKVAGLLELGAGFHPELTGRENIKFKAAILGMSKKEITAKEDEIIAFSELEDFIDTPIKYYSSGMYARLGFSVAVHRNPDILLIDEVLSVGDAPFRDKCIVKVEEFCQDKNKTIIFVSHNFDYIKQLCQKVYWFDKGKIKKIGKPKEVISAYLKAVTKEK